jgi:acyl-CoA synthetase (AMP-forming)/AMP-acid ligase II
VTWLADLLAGCPRLAGRYLFGAERTAELAEIARGTTLDGRRAELHGRAVLLATRDQLPTALALIELDGVARRIVICPADVAPRHFPTVIADTGIDALVCDDGFAADGVGLRVVAGPIVSHAPPALPRVDTEWVLLTSGTTGAPKAVAHSLASLTGAIAVCPQDPPPVWGTFYDMRRYGGLQIFLRAILGGGSMILSSATEPVGDHLARLGRHGATHISGTPSHWRRVLMSPDARLIAPRTIRLSGEIADQTILDHLRVAFPHAEIGHAYASTEAGVGFEVTDGLEGFPAEFLGRNDRDVELKIEDGSLRIRSPRAATGYLGRSDERLFDADGFVDTGDMIERRGDRCYFVGRRGGVINVGGQKVHPEEVEAIINCHPAVRMSLVHAKRSPIMGSIVVADVVASGLDAASAGERKVALRREILDLCRDGLAQYKVPADIRFVQSLEVGTAGKMVRRHA